MASNGGVSRRLCFDRGVVLDGRAERDDDRSFQLLFRRFMRNLPQLPVPEDQDVDILGLQKAGKGVLFTLYSEVGVFADVYDVPADLLWVVVVDWIVSDHTGRQRTPVELLVPADRTA